MDLLLLMLAYISLKYSPSTSSFAPSLPSCRRIRFSTAYLNVELVLIIKRVPYSRAASIRLLCLCAASSLRGKCCKWRLWDRWHHTCSLWGPKNRWIWWVHWSYLFYLLRNLRFAGRGRLIPSVCWCWACRIRYFWTCWSQKLSTCECCLFVKLNCSLLSSIAQW